MKQLLLFLILNLFIFSCSFKHKKWDSNYDLVNKEISVSVFYSNPACYCPDWQLTKDKGKSNDESFFNLLPLDTNIQIPSKYLFAPNTIQLKGNFFKFKKSLGDIESGGYSKTFGYSSFQLSDTMFYYNESGDLKFDLIKN